MILAGPPNPISYTFFVGMTSVFVFLLIPFIDLDLPPLAALGWIMADALVFILGLYFIFSAMERFEVSKVMTTVGAIQPLFVFALTWFFWGPQIITKIDVLAFLLLLFGSLLISIEKNHITAKGYVQITLAGALMFSLDYIFSKMVYLSLPFLEGLFWMKFFVLIFALCMLLVKANRKIILKKENVNNTKTSALFLFAQGSGGVANILQAFAISLAPVAFLPIVNSLRGVQYVFLFLITLFFTLFFPKILKEKISKQILVQKITAIIMIVVGLAVLVAY